MASQLVADAELVEHERHLCSGSTVEAAFAQAFAAAVELDTEAGSTHRMDYQAQPTPAEKTDLKQKEFEE